ncbi:Cobyrinic acid ac-diamide synthase [Cupriavidus taiwanensis]|uniref:ParA family partition ATPase n=1 Tax=Cupriavidus taiwanensis TaxID=164546 RepID=UPI000E1B1D4B|nr:ParA family partition ATPase [Cupriavidus taiwanensis]SPA23663.1 Cobyrinic acid ac-diamide synthase [Cupriavidus taiwanensis]
MAARIITVFNQKGGAGKTTVACNVAGTLGLRDHKTLLVDMDEQSTASIWASMAPEDRPFPATPVNLAKIANAHREIRKFVPDYDFIVIDCPPAIQSSAPSVALLISDLALIPVGPSGGNLWALEQAKKLATNAQATNEALRVRTVANMNQNSTIIRQVFEALAEDEEMPMLKTKLGNRSAYKEAEATGQTVVSLSGAKEAKQEMNRLVDEILSVLEK